MYGMSVLFGALTDRSESAEDFGSFRQAQRERVQIHNHLRHLPMGRAGKSDTRSTYKLL
jgi:hypothetical protein